MSTVTFDTLKFVKTLEASGIDAKALMQNRPKLSLQHTVMHPPINS